MNKKIFIARIEWIKNKEKISFKEEKYCPQISVEGEYVVNGSAWSVFCYNFEMIDLNKTKSYIRYLNQNDAPDNLKVESKFGLHIMGKVVANGEIIGISESNF